MDLEIQLSDRISREIRILELAANESLRRSKRRRWLLTELLLTVGFALVGVGFSAASSFVHMQDSPKHMAIIFAIGPVLLVVPWVFSRLLSDFDVEVRVPGKVLTDREFARQRHLYVSMRPDLARLHAVLEEQRETLLESELLNRDSATRDAAPVAEPTSSSGT